MNTFSRDLMNLPAPGNHYRHWKGDLYIVCGLTADAETGDIRVSYENADPALRKVIPFSRTLRNFTEEVEPGKRRFMHAIDFLKA